MKQFVKLFFIFSISSSLYAATIPKTVVTCTNQSCPAVPAILGDNDQLTNQVIVFQTSNKPEFMNRSVTAFTNHNNGGWQHIVIDETQFANTQPIIGFGGAFTDSASMLYQHMSEVLQKEFIQAYFSKQGIAYSLGRVPIASADFSCRINENNQSIPSLKNCENLASQYSYADQADETLNQFALQTEDTNYKIPMIKAALSSVENNTIKLFASPWSAPAWMKTNGSMVHGNLNSSLQQVWANYFVKFLQTYKNNQITFWGVTVQNEPDENGFLDKRDMQTWQSMYFTKEQEAEFVKNYLGPTLKKFTQAYGAKIHLIMHDDQITTITQRTTVLSDKDLAQYVDGLALHWYMNLDNDYPNLDVAYQRLQTQRTDSFILGSEACEGYSPFSPGPDLGNWARGEAYGHDIISDINHHVSGWTDWNLALDMQGGPNWAKNYVDAPILIDVDKQTFYEQPMYFYLGHFSKFVRPESRLLTSQSSGPFPLEEVSFKVPAQQNLPETIVIIVLNRDITGRTYYIRDDSLQSDNKYLNMNIPAHAIQTILYKAKSA